MKFNCQLCSVGKRNYLVAYNGFAKTNAFTVNYQFVINGKAIGWKLACKQVVEIAEALRHVDSMTEENAIAFLDDYIKNDVGQAVYSFGLIDKKIELAGSKFYAIAC